MCLRVVPDSGGMIGRAGALSRCRADTSSKECADLRFPATWAKYAHRTANHRCRDSGSRRGVLRHSDPCHQRGHRV